MDIAQLKWRCRRGMLELDLLLTGFLDNGYAALDAKGCAQFERLLDYPDQTLHDWLLGLEPVMEEELVDVVISIRNAT